MDERDRRAGENEALFRHVNERIEGINRTFAVLSERMHVVCECGRADCVERIELTVADYERVRADPRRFALVEGHDDPRVERVVEEADGWVVVEKDPGEPSRLAEKTDPRS